MLHIDHLPYTRRILNRQRIRISARGPGNAKSGKPRSIDFRRKCGVYHGNEQRQMIGHCMLYIDHLPFTRRILNRQQIRVSARPPSNQNPETPFQRRSKTICRLPLQHASPDDRRLHDTVHIDHLPSTPCTKNRKQIRVSARAPCNTKSGNPVPATVEDHLPSTAARSIAR